MWAAFSKWARQHLFGRPSCSGATRAQDLSMQMGDGADALREEALALHKELAAVQTVADERGTNPLAELVNSMRRGRRELNK